MANGKEGLQEPHLDNDPDEDLNEQLAEEDTSDFDDNGDDESFEFDASLYLKGVKVVDLTPDFVRPDGFLMVPRLNKKTGEIFPKTATFAGILKDVIPWTDNRKKQRVWFACEATATIPKTFFTGRDEENKPFQKPVKKGMRIGISGSGAINALKSKKGHFVLLHWTGNKVTVKNGDMWEVIAKVSEEPVVAD